MGPKPGPKLVAVSARLKQELIHPNRTSVLWDTGYSPDGKRIIAGDYPGGVVVVWDVASGKQLTTIESGYGHRSGGEYFFLSPDWQTLFVSRSKQKVERVEQNGKRLSRFTFDAEVRAWDLTTGRLQKTYQHQPPRYISGMQLSPDGTKLVTFEEPPGVFEGRPKQTVSLWDVATGRYRPLPTGLSSFGRFSRDGRTLAITADEDGYTQAVKLFDTATCQEKLSIAVGDKHAWTYVAAFSPDDRLLVGSYTVYEGPKKYDKSQNWLKWWDVAAGREIASFAAEKDTGGLANHRFSADGQTFAATNWLGEKSKLFLFRVPEKRLDKVVILGEKPKGQRLIARAPAFSPDGKWIAVITQVFPDTRGGDEPDARDRPQARIHLIDVVTGEIRETLISPQGFVVSSCFSPDGRTLATGGHGRVLLWDLTKPPVLTATARQP